jgi:beta-xylosidase
MRQVLILTAVAALTATLVFAHNGNRSSHALAATDVSATRANAVSATAKVATVATVASVASAPQTRSAKAKATSPVVYSEDFPDPFVLTTSTGYVAFSTNSRGMNVPELVSSDLVNWSAAADALPTLPDWARKSGTWAPSVVEVNGTYVMYVTLFDTRRGVECIFSAAAVTATGPYAVTDSEPLRCATNGSIDPSVFTDSHGRLWLTWKDEAQGKRAATISAAQLQSDGLSFATRPTALLTASETWERDNVEGPSLVRSGDHYVLFFSTGAWTSSGYSTGYATCATPVGPCTVHDGPWLSSADGLDGPGGLQVFTATDGATYAAFHTWLPCTDCSQWKRVLNIGRLDLDGTAPVLTPVGAAA